MIMQAKPPRSLSRAGLLAILGLGMLLLPVRAMNFAQPSVGQTSTTTKQDDSGARNSGSDTTDKVGNATVVSTDEPAQRDKSSQEDIAKAEAAVKKLDKELAARRNEMLKAERLYQDALTRLLLLRGQIKIIGVAGAPGKDGQFLYYGNTGAYQPKVVETPTAVYSVPMQGYSFSTNPGGKVASTPGATLSYVPATGSAPSYTTTAPVPAVAADHRPKDRTTVTKPGDMETKLDRLSRELESLRRELRRERSKQSDKGKE